MKKPLIRWGMPEQGIKESRERKGKNGRPLAVGLRILTQIPEPAEPHIVVKSEAAARLRQVNSRSRARPRSGSDLEYSCFLKTCSLCHKKLSPDQDIYMYRGDEGYCSVECRERRITMDEMKELEASTKRMMSSPRHCYVASPQSETGLLCEELRRRRCHLIAPKTRTIVL